MINGIIKLFYTEIVKNKMKNLPKEEYELNDQFKKIQNVSFKIDRLMFIVLKIFIALSILLVSFRQSVYLGIGMFFVELSYIFYKRTFKTKVKSEINNIKTNINNNKENILKQNGKKNMSFLISILLLGVITGFSKILVVCFFIVFIVTIKDIYINYRDNRKLN